MVIIVASDLTWTFIATAARPSHNFFVASVTVSYSDVLNSLIDAWLKIFICSLRSSVLGQFRDLNFPIWVRIYIPIILVWPIVQSGPELNIRPRPIHYILTYLLTGMLKCRQHTKLAVFNAFNAFWAIVNSGSRKNIDVFVYTLHHVRLSSVSMRSFSSTVGLVCSKPIGLYIERNTTFTRTCDNVGLNSINTGCAKKWPNLFFVRTSSNLHQMW